MNVRNLQENRGMAGVHWGVALALVGAMVSGCAVEPDTDEGDEAGNAASTEATTESEAAPPEMEFVAGEAIARGDRKFEELASASGLQAQSAGLIGYIWGERDISGGLFGQRYDFVFGLDRCPWGGTKSHAEAWAYNNNNGQTNCSIVRWYNDGDPRDCRVIVHVGSNALQPGTCVTRVWVQ
jgi:hypothetical protein